MLRRYGEQALTEDVRAILKDWNAHLQTCGLIFISCPKTMRSVLFEEGLKDKDTPLKRNDPRVRLVPFMVCIPYVPILIMITHPFLCPMFICSNVRTSIPHYSVLFETYL